MTRALIVCVIALAAACAVILLAWKKAARDRAALRKRCAEMEGTLHSVLTRLSQVEKAAKIAADNRREADAKIDALHSGDGVGNALDVLSKQ